MIDGIITKGIGGFYYILANDEIYECKARGIFRKNKITPMVGDHVVIKAKNGKGSIEEIKPRKSSLVRPAVANVDVLIIVVAAASPDPNLLLIDKMLVQAHENNIEPIICINKTDLKKCDEIVEIYEKAGYKVIAVSAENNENLEEIFDLLEGKVTAFAGLSGVGKSSILNIITEAEMETGGLSEKISRGKHTTRHVELIPVKGGFVFDTPGFSSLELTHIPLNELHHYFPEMNNLSNLCKFRDCSHTKDQLDCAVISAVENNEISKSRYDSYCELYDIIKGIKKY